MLKSLFIKNYILISQLDLDFSNGFHAFTGETGAGKSIIVGALSLILGNRADYSVIRKNENKCEISALFDISKNNEAKLWLSQQDIEHSNEVDCRRIISDDGKSKSWINSRPCSNTTLKELGSMLVQIHGQHDQIKLNNPKYQIKVIDDSGNYQNHLLELEKIYGSWKRVKSELDKMKLAGALTEAESQLLQYQYEELEQLGLVEDELDELHLQQKSLTHAVDTLEILDTSLNLLSGEDQFNLNQALSHVISNLKRINGVDVSEILIMLDEVSINLNEVEVELQSKHESIEVNPKKLNQVETRLDDIYQTARKHKVTPENLYQHYLALGEKLSLNDSQKQNREKLLIAKNDLEQNYLTQSQILSNARLKSSKQFASNVTDVIQKLGLIKAQFLVNINHEKESSFSAIGQDKIDFQVIMNPGQSPQSMSKTASGGELSRIALAIEICKKQESQNSSFVFDEVDAGIGGAVAETVGKLMRQLSENQQVFAVTHLPHVAGLSHHHFLVSKQEIKGLTESSVDLLDTDQRVQELARMSGGSTITETTLEQAKAFMLG